MTSFIFCLIFLQVSIFFIATGILAYWACRTYWQREAEPVRAACRVRVRPRRLRAVERVDSF